MSKKQDAYSDHILGLIINPKSIRAGVIKELGTLFTLYVVLLANVTGKNMAVTLSLGAMSKMTGKTRTTIGRQLCAMKELNIIDIVSGKNNRPNKYIIKEKY
jgi:hypothetical protein